ncbi:polyketide synthase [Diaporthe helianthi]|uniref:Polyketide synthase n=1 Tax=Diaporthe helianthi TaxID=158607 RepID=A0A2P5HGD3_DIAHE|nr:polyketide synthase [Diaporthe helianthi]
MLWKPGFELVDISKVLRPAVDSRHEHALVKRLFFLCAIETQASLRGTAANAAHPHLERYRSWIDKTLGHAQASGTYHPAVPDALALFRFSSSQRQELIEQVYCSNQNTLVKALGTEMYRIYKHNEDIFSGAVDPIELLLRDDLLPAFCDCTGGLTTRILQGLQSEFGGRLYLSYTYTDVSAGAGVVTQVGSNVGHLKTVLIHSAAGGVGIAAIIVAKWIGATIYATVGNEQKMECVAPYNTMLEIGKRDMVGRGMLAMDWFEDNRSFVFIDCGGTTDQIEEAFRMMQKGPHMGKLHPDKAYILVGGMGGLGRSIALWIVEQIARHLVFISRSSEKSHEDIELCNELAEMGCYARTIACSVADKDTLSSTWNRGRQPRSPRSRVHGSSNLHELTGGGGGGDGDGDGVDFFVLLSSGSGVCGYWGQANYASANSFLDAFAAYRQSLGLPASVIDIGAVGDVGYVTRDSKAVDMFHAASVRLISEKELLDCLHLAMFIYRPGCAVATHPDKRGIFNPSQVVTGLSCHLPPSDKHDPRFSLYRTLEEASPQGTGAAVASDGHLRHFIQSAMADPSLLDQQQSSDYLAQEIASRVKIFLLRDEEDDFPLVQTLGDVNRG